MVVPCLRLFTWLSRFIRISSIHTVLHKYLVEKKEGLEESFQLLRNKQNGFDNVKGGKTFMDLKIYPVVTKVLSRNVLNLLQYYYLYRWPIVSAA